MNILILFLLLFIAGIFIITFSKKAKEPEIWPYYAKKPLSPPEQILYFRLCKALPEHIILAQVQLSRILGVEKGNNFNTWNNRINRMSIDYAVCNKDSSIIAVIELDDSSHQKKDRQITDEKKDKALKSAGINIIRWSIKKIPNEATIKTQFS